MTQKTIFLHIGSGKTGTSTIQGTLHQNRKLLKENGVFAFPHVVGLLAEVVSDPMKLTPVRMRKIPQAQVENLQRSAMQALEKWGERAGEPVSIVSNEHFLSLKEPDLARLSAKLRTVTDEIKVVFYARHPASKMSALLEQQVKAGLLRLDAPMDRLVERFDRRLPLWAEAFGKDNMIVRKFERGALFRDNPYYDICEVVGRRDICDLIEPVYRNEGTSYAAILLADALNAFAPAFSDERAAADYLTQIAGPKFTLPPEAVQSVKGSVTKQLDYLKSEYGIEFSPFVPKPAAEMKDVFSAEVLTSLAQILNSQSARIRELEAQVASSTAISG